MEPDEVERLGYLTKAYDELIDATKHQDDKIGRVFTGVAFLTSAVLTIGLVTNGGVARQRYAVPPFPESPVVAIAIGTYVVATIAAVLHLLINLTTTLRLPRAGQGVRGELASQLFFLDIAQSRPSDWQNQWLGDMDGIRQHRKENLIEETLNLAQRTAVKYMRTSEAGALLLISFTSFALTAVLVLVGLASTPAATSTLTPPSTVQFYLGERIAVGAALMTVTFVFLFSQQRSSALLDTRDARKNYTVVLVPFWFAALALPTGRSVVAGLGALVIAMVFAVIWRKAAQDPKRRLPLLPIVLVLIVFALGVGAAFGEWGFRLVAMYVTATCIPGIALLGPFYQVRGWRREAAFRSAGDA